MKIINTQQINQQQMMNEKQLRLLNLQKEYEIKVQGEVGKILNESYAIIENKQEKMFEKMQSDLQKAIDEMVKAVDMSTAKCNQAAKRAENATDKVFKIEKWRDLLQYVAPAAVLLNLLFRVFQHFAGG